jgi:hypothetical protein
MALISGSLPPQTCYGTPQQMLDLFAQYLSIPTQNVILEKTFSTNFNGTAVTTVPTQRTASVAVAGASSGDPVLIGVPNNPPSGVIYDGYASSNTVYIRATFLTAQTPGTVTFKVKVLKASS